MTRMPGEMALFSYRLGPTRCLSEPHLVNSRSRTASINLNSLANS
jgi:hypothetical protein